MTCSEHCGATTCGHDGHRGSVPLAENDTMVLKNDNMGLENDTMELKATRFEVDGHIATVYLHRPHRHNAWTGRMHTELRWVMAELETDAEIRAVVVTGTPPAFSVGGDSEALAQHADRGGYDTGLPAEPARPGVNMRPRVRRRLRVDVRVPDTDHRRGERRRGRHRTRARPVRRPALRCRARQDHHRRAQARAAGRIRHELGTAPPGRRHARRRPPALGPRRHGRRHVRVGALERRAPRRRQRARCCDNLRAPARGHGRPARRQRHQGSAVPRHPSPRRRGVGRRVEAAARRRDGQPPSTARVWLRSASGERPSSDPLGPTCDRPATDLGPTP